MTKTEEMFKLVVAQSRSGKTRRAYAEGIGMRPVHHVSAAAGENFTENSKANTRPGSLFH